MNARYRKMRLLQKKLLLHLLKFPQTRLDQIILGSSIAKYFWELLVMSVLLELNSFVRKWIITKSRSAHDDRRISSARRRSTTYKDKTMLNLLNVKC